MSSSYVTLQLVLKRVARSSRTLIAFVVACCLIYALFLSVYSGKSEKKQQQHHDDNETYEDRPLDPKSVREQMAYFRERIDRLQSTLDRTKQDAEQLKNLLKKASFDMKLIHLVNNENENNNKPQTTKELITAKKIAVLVMACNRPNAIDDHLKALVERRSRSPRHVDMFPIVVSQDCNHEPTSQTIEKHKPSLHTVLRQPDQSDIVRGPAGEGIPRHLQGYFKISRHYKWALEQVFGKLGFDSVIITEDDLALAVDFFDYFEATHDVLSKDPSLYCVSAWNDNGKENFIDTSKPEMVHRTDFFPGLGWMMRKELWHELRDKWPAGYWDDWMRESPQRLNRSCLRPEISRTGFSAHGKAGVSLGLFFDTYLKLIVINDKSVDWTRINTDYLIKANYDPVFLKEVYDNEQVFELTLDEFKKKQQSELDGSRPVRIVYKNQGDLNQLTKHFSIMSDLRNGVPRTSYLGVIRIVLNKKQVVYLVPYQKKVWSGYDPTWN